MSPELLKRCLDLLDVQYGYIARDNRGFALDYSNNRSQEVYYKGMRTMLEMILTNDYAEEGYIIYDKGTGKHVWISKKEEKA